MTRHVFISSTLEDLILHRQMAAEVVRQLGLHSLDIFQHEPITPDLVAANMTALAQADLFIGLYATRYGNVLPNEEVSLTEWLYSEARQRKIPRLIYLASHHETLSGEYLGTDEKSAMMRMFVDRLQEENPQLRYFSTPHDLAEKLRFDVARFTKQPQVHQYQRRHFMLGLLTVWVIILIVALLVGPIR